MRRITKDRAPVNPSIDINRIPDRRRVATALKYSADAGSEASQSVVERRIPIDERTGKRGSEIASFPPEDAQTVIGALAVYTADNIEPNLENWPERVRTISLIGEIVVSAAEEIAGRSQPRELE